MFFSFGVTVNVFVAVGENGVIGKGNKIPWRSNFLNQVRDGVVVCGRKTWCSLPDRLPVQKVFVVSRSGIPEEDQESHPTLMKLTTVKSSIKGAITAACGFADAVDLPEIGIIGGAEIYTQVLAKKLATNVFVSRIYFTADSPDYTYFPEDLLVKNYKFVTTVPQEQDGDCWRSVELWEKRWFW